MRTKLYLASTEGLDEALMIQLAQTLPPSRREKLDALRAPEARRLSLGAGLLLNYALAAEGLSPMDCALTEYGKPYFPALPDFHFSLSHSADRVLCAVSPAPVGCDVEGTGRYNPKLAERCFHPDESAWLFSLPEAERPDGFLRLWTCKESFIKAVGLGLGMPLRDFAVSFGDCVTLRQSTDPRPWRLRSFRGDGCFFALCALTDVEDLAPVPVKLWEGGLS